MINNILISDVKMITIKNNHVYDMLLNNFFITFNLIILI